MAGPAARQQSTIYAAQTAREAALFVAVVALLVDAAFYFAVSNAQLAGRPLSIWSASKVLVIVVTTLWLAVDRREWSLGLIAAIFVLIGLEDSVGITAPLGIWLIEEAGIGRGPQGTNSQLLRRALVTLGLLGPTVFLASKAKRKMRKGVWILLGFLGAIFVVAVLGDVFTDRTGTNLDELLEEPILSLAAAFSVGLAVDSWPARRR
ncbi:MAG: hypothetical protein HKN91_07675 [Acidimicrobiia bacterium]|nr:hypothetical protein [Acidimicrobiia bacterium]